jgi:hypothetical protein
MDDRIAQHGTDTRPLSPNALQRQSVVQGKGHDELKHTLLTPLMKPVLNVRNCPFDKPEIENAGSWCAILNQSHALVHIPSHCSMPL